MSDLSAEAQGAAAVATGQVSPRDASAPPPPVPQTAQTTPPRASADMQAVLDALAALNPQPLTSLAPAQARTQPSFADAYQRVAQQRGIELKTNAVTTTDYPYGSDDEQFVRVYRPAGTTADSDLPLVVYYHGGGWVIANVDVYDATPRYLAEAMNAVVVSVEYRHAPEFKFPAQHEDAAAAYRFAIENADSWGADPERLGLLGESAGGNLVIATAIYARDNGLMMPDHIVSVYPIANSSMDLPSRRDSAQAKPLNTAALNWFGYYYKSQPSDAQDPRINLVEADLQGLPPVTIINAQADPLRSDGETLAAALRQAGVPVEQRVFEGTTHEFFGMGKVVPAALQAEQYAVRRMQADLD
ncbi:alpha/beta hydrolase [Croceicoccus marinus]|uniref:Alpha/beta hydrolase n=1 Tax=Croceicoccus marinus TaxID=450378 RepID=A0A7G6VSL1_9SPHN|nr:alpha/beta hydrolase [Croceicoccus marinus]QNE04726.1 alpha/beta hydrolase [Croceicoccus marinus]